MDVNNYIVNYNVNNVNIPCFIQEKDAIINRQQKELDEFRKAIEELRKANQILTKDNEKLKNDIDLYKKLNESLEKFKYSLERNISVLKEFDKNRWSISDAESEVKIWEHEYLMVRKAIDKREREEAIVMNATNTVAVVYGPNNGKQSTPKRNPYKPKIAEDGSAIKRYVCDYPNCGYRSNWAHDLKGHKRKHTGEKPYTCGWLNCNKSFRDLRDLKRHQRAHTGDKRYSCDWPGCDYRSTDVANLAKHKRTHTGEKPYKCDWAGCEASFADGSHLRRHQKKHENQVAKLTKPSSKNKKISLPKNSVIKIRQQPGRKAKSGGIPLEVILDVAGDEVSRKEENDKNQRKLKSDNNSERPDEVKGGVSGVSLLLPIDKEKQKERSVNSIITDNSNISITNSNTNNNALNDGYISVTTLTNVEVVANNSPLDDRLERRSHDDNDNIEREMSEEIIVASNNEQLDETGESEHIVIRSMEPLSIDNYNCSSSDYERVQLVVSESSSYLGINSVIQINSSNREK